MSLFCKLLLYASMMAFVTLAHAYDISEGVGVVCDSQAQIERFAALEAKPEAIKTINDNAHQNVCVMASVRYIWGHEISRVRSATQTMQIVKILVLQFEMHGNWTSIPPVIQYTVFSIHEEAA